MVFALEGLVLGKRDTGSLATLGCFEFGGDADSVLRGKKSLCKIDTVLIWFWLCFSRRW